MMVVTTILALVSVAVVPSLLSMKASADYRETVSGVRRFAAEARERAIQNAKETQVVYDESTKQLQIQDVDSDGTGTTVTSVELLAGVEPQRFQLAGKDSGPDDFKLTFTPDGHSVGGGIEFQDYSVLVDTNGISQFIKGTLPDPSEQQWQAGNLEQRN
jgi:type II secretory pathway pseudopilin PulG